MNIKNKIKSISQSKFLHNVALVAMGTAGAQAITMVCAPIITRLYGPEAFGLLGTFQAILIIATPIAALTYPIAIVLPKSDDDAWGIAKLSARIAFFMALSLATILLIAGDEISTLLGAQSISKFLLLIPLAMFFSALQQIMQQWLIRKKQFKVTARVAVSQSFILNSAKTVTGLFYPFGFVLIVLTALSNMLYAAQLWLGARKWGMQGDKFNRSVASDIDLKSLAYRHRDFPFYRAPQVFLNAISQGLPVLMLASFFGPASAGFYSLGRTVLDIPSTVLGEAVGQVFYPRIAKAANNHENLPILILKATALLGAVGFIPFFIVIILGPVLFEFVFGKEWYVAGEYARWLALWLYFMFINKPSNHAIPVLNIQRFYLIFTIVSLVVRSVALYVGFSYFKSDLAAIILFSISSVLINISIILIVLYRSVLFVKAGNKNG